MANPMPEDVANLERALALIRDNAGAESVDWGVDWESVASSWISFDQHKNLRRLARTAIAYHEERLSRGEHERFVGDMAALLRTGRHFAMGQGLGQYQTMMGIEAILRAATANHATRLPPDVRDDMLRVWKEAASGPDLLNVFDVERRAMRGYLWDAFAGTTDLREGRPGMTLGASSGLADDLRISSFLSIAEEVFVGFEDAETGESFSLRPGGQRGELELVWVDPVDVRALVRRGDESAIIELSDRVLLPINPEAAWERVNKWVGHVTRTEEQTEAGNDLLARLLEEAGGDPVGAFEALLASFDAAADEIIPRLSTSYADLPDWRKIATEGPGLFGELLAPFLRRAELDRTASYELLSAGLNYLRDPASPLPDSDVTGDPIRLKETDERVTLESTFQRGDRPLTLVFPIR